MQKNLNSTFGKMLKSYFQNELLEAGCDEAGRGCLAGPVFAASVVLPLNFKHPLLNDSKQMGAADRYTLRDIIKEEALAWGVAQIDHDEIDQINILKASFKAMHKAIDQLQTKPRLLLIDGHMFYAYPGIKHECVVKGDATYASIAAASVLAKTYRDDYMMQLHEQYPHYGWASNKGYGTLEHRNAIVKHGLSPYHRKSFQLKNTQIPLEFTGK
jgi:ribonuclease HII